jgi:membrane-associated phospholipid phosphatase
MVAAMVRPLASIALFAALVALVPAVAFPKPAAAETKADRQRTTRIAAITAAGILYATSETVFKDALAPDDCRWCGVNGFDGNIRETFVWDDTERAHAISNLTGYVSSPLVAATLLFVSSRHEEERFVVFVDDMIPVFESVMYSQLVVQAIKFSFGRQRPYAHFATGPRPRSQDENLSFLSGHSALTFSIAAAAGTVASQRGYELAPVIWASGLGLAATTAYLRIAADRHYGSDVLCGSALGLAAGLLIPRLSGSLPPEVRVVPTGDGVAVVGRF